MKRILKLTLTHKWFYLIATGKKTVEYREFKKHWHQRLFHNGTTVAIGGVFREYDEIHFTNGYGHDKPFMRVEFNGVDVVANNEHEPDNDEPLEPGKSSYVIELGEVLEIKRAQSWRLSGRSGTNCI